jgi:hypothetical protein
VASRDAPEETLRSPLAAGRRSVRSLEGKDRASPPTAFDALRPLAAATSPRDHFDARGALNDKPVEASNSRRPRTAFSRARRKAEGRRVARRVGFPARRSSPSTPASRKLPRAPVPHRGRKATRQIGGRRPIEAFKPRAAARARRGGEVAGRRGGPSRRFERGVVPVALARKVQCGGALL